MTKQTQIPLFFLSFPSLYTPIFIRSYFNLFAFVLHKFIKHTDKQIIQSKITHGVLGFWGFGVLGTRHNDK